MSDHRPKPDRTKALPRVEPSASDMADTPSAHADETRYEFEQLLGDALKLDLNKLSGEGEFSELISRLKNPQKLQRLLEDLDAAPRAEGATERKRIGQFELLESLGGGGMGQVFKARHLQLGRLVAVKMLHPHRLEDPTIIRRFRQEMRAVGQLQNPHIVSASHADEEDGLPYLVMDYVQGQSLQQLANKLEQSNQRLSVGVACELIRQAAIGIQFAHEQGIIHRDLKPGNLMLDQTGMVRVLDLGLAKIIHESESSDLGATTVEPMTGEHQVIGTPDYMAPEQIDGTGSADERTDIYALGATLFRLLTGAVVFPSRNAQEKFVAKAIRILHDPAPDVRDLRPDVDVQLAALISSCLSKDPSARIQTAGELAKRLAAWADSAQVHALASQSSATSAITATVKNPPSVSPLQTPKSPRPVRNLSERKRVATAAGSGWHFGNKFLIAAAAAFFPLALAAWLVYRFALPGGGELVIECTEDVQLTVRAVQEEQVETLDLIRKPSGKLELATGPWQLTLQGVDAEEFKLSDDTIVVSKGEQLQVRISRSTPPQASVHSTTPAVDVEEPMSQDIARSDDSEDALQLEASVRIEYPPVFQRDETNPLFTDPDSSVEEPVQSSAPEYQRSILPGLVLQPTVEDELFEWQILRKRPLSGMQTDNWKWSVEHFDVNRDGTRWVDSLGSYVLVRDCQSGQVKALVTRGRSHEFLHSVAFRPAEDSFAVLVHSLLDQRQDAVEIRSATGLLEQRIEYGKDLPPSSEIGRFNFTWSGDGKRLLVWSMKHLLVYDNNGELLSKFQFDDTSGPATEFAQVPRGIHATAHPKTSHLTLVCRDSVIRTWDLVDGSVQDVTRIGMSTRPEGLDVFIRWSPSGKHLLVTGLDESGENRIAQVYSWEGKRIAISPRDWDHADWSRDGKFLVTDRGQILDLNLRQIRVLPFSEHDPLPGAMRYPYWTNGDQIVLVYADDRWQRHSGMIRMFRRNGAEIPTLADPQPLQPMSADLLSDGRIAAAYHRGGTHRLLYQWSKEGIGRPAAQLPEQTPTGVQLQPYEAALSSQNNRFTLRSPWRQIVLDVDGKLLDETILVGEERHDAAYQPHGNLLAFVQQPDQSLVVQDARGSTIRTLRPASYNAMLRWSPDGRFLAWQHPSPDGNSNITSAVDLQTKDSQPRSLGDAAGRVSFSPDGKWLACLVADQNSEKLVVTDLMSDRRLEVPVKTVSGVRAAPVWLPDSQHIFAGHVYQIGSDDVLVKKGDAEFHDWLGGVASPSKNQLIVFARQKEGHPILHTVDANGAVLRSIQIAGQVLPSAINGSSSQSIHDPQRSERMASLVSEEGFQEPHSIMLTSIDGQQAPTPLWNGIAFDDGATLTIGAEGEILNASNNGSLDRYLLHAVRYPNGPSIPLTQKAFQVRRSLDQNRQAMLWAVDMEARVQLASGDTWKPTLRSFDALSTFDKWPQIEDVSTIDLSGRKELSDLELQFVSRFANLKQLNLANTSIRDVTSLVNLSQLETLDLSNTQVEELVSLSKLSSLRQLNLSGCNVTAFDIALLKEAIPECSIQQTVP